MGALLTRTDLAAAAAPVWAAGESEAFGLAGAGRLDGAISVSPPSAPPAGFPAVLYLASMSVDQGFRMTGVGQHTYWEFHVADAGDVNGDGHDDIIVGDHGAAPGGMAEAGSAFVLFGKSHDLHANIDLTALDGSDGFRLDGAAAGDLAGSSVASAGDVNGDGYGDLIVGAPMADPQGLDYAGSAYVVFGHAGGFAASASLADLDGGNGFRLDGHLAEDDAGYDVSSAGDFNGDGYGDLLVGAPNANSGGRQYSGASYVVFGKADGFSASLDLSKLHGDDGFVITGVSARDALGCQLSTAGDVNGDGYGDLIIGAPFAAPDGQGNYAGRSYVLFGRAGAMPASFDPANLNGSNGFRIDGAPGSFGGWAIDTAGDFNGDGYGDLTIGAVMGGVDVSGTSYVLYGRAHGFNPVVNLAGLDGTHGFRVVDNIAGEWSGRCISYAGDVNADGFGDILIGAPASHPDGYAQGSAYVVFGTAAGMPAEFDLASLDGTNGFRINGEVGHFTGSAVSQAGDVNGDGVDDLIVAADSYGESYVVYGQLPQEAVTRIGGRGGQTIQGGAFDDKLKGLAGDDVLIGHGGSDRIYGGLGADTLDGGVGKDRFHFQAVADSTATATDLIVDLQDGDKIHLSHIDADTTQAGDQAFHLVATFSGAAGELMASYDAGTDITSFLGDVDGDGVADLVIQATGDHSLFDHFAL